jgi:radical SAM protein with 4Fe4S-binding SPASM domain
MQSYSDKLVTKVHDLPKRLLLGLNDGYCNLKCPACYVHGSNSHHSVKELRGYMPFNEACKIFDEVRGSGIFVSPILWSEPLLIKDLHQYLRVIKDRGLHTFINTNGLLLTEELAQFFVSIQLHTVFVSVDAITNKTLKKVRGIDDLEKIREAVFRMLRARGDMTSPRIGVSFVESKINNHERDEFVSYWLQHVDVVRVTNVYETDNKISKTDLPERVPCGALYDTMAINHQGDVPICCLDSFNETNMGNVFQSGLKNVWHCEKFQEVRYYHEMSQYEKVPLCKNCDVWANYISNEKEINGVLVCQSPIITYYNRIDRLYSWKSRIR